LESVRVENIGKRFGRNTVLDQVDFEVPSGSSCCLWGPNGAGKSTLLKIIAGLLRPTRGKVTCTGGGRSGGPDDFHGDMGMAAPDVVLYPELTPGENLDFLARSRGSRRDSEFEASLVSALFPDGLKDEPVSTFSSGMRGKLGLIAALAHRPGLLLLDEPTSYFDGEGKTAAAGIMDSLKTGIILIVATNDPAEREWCDTTYELRV